MKRIAMVAALLLIGCPTKPAPKSNPPPPVGSDMGSSMGSSGGPGSADPGSGTAQTPPPPPPPPQGPSTGEKCAANDACGAGLECVKYYGIAGPRGPEFKTCEKRCKVAADCGTGKCVTIADGPGQVCR